MYLTDTGLQMSYEMILSSKTDQEKNLIFYQLIHYKNHVCIQIISMSTMRSEVKEKYHVAAHMKNTWCLC